MTAVRRERRYQHPKPTLAYHSLSTQGRVCGRCTHEPAMVRQRETWGGCAFRGWMDVKPPSANAGPNYVVVREVHGQCWLGGADWLLAGTSFLVRQASRRVSPQVQVHSTAQSPVQCESPVSTLHNCMFQCPLQSFRHTAHTTAQPPAHITAQPPVQCPHCTTACFSAHCKAFSTLTLHNGATHY